MTFWSEQAQQAALGLHTGDTFALFAALMAQAEQLDRIANALEEIATQNSGILDDGRGMPRWTSEEEE